MSNQDKPAFPVGEDVTQGQFAPEPGMSLREYAAIKLRVPDSGTDWLDAMIEKSLLNDFAEKALNGMITTSGAPSLSGFDGYEPVMVRSAYRMANAMLKASKGE